MDIERSRDNVRSLNDVFRSTFNGGRVMMTAGVKALKNDERAAVIGKVMAFDAFTLDEDPNGEHDLGVFDHAGSKFLWKIDYFNLTMDGCSPDPNDPNATTRVLTVMLLDEY